MRYLAVFAVVAFVIGCENKSGPTIVGNLGSSPKVTGSPSSSKSGDQAGRDDSEARHYETADQLSKRLESKELQEASAEDLKNIDNLGVTIYPGSTIPKDKKPLLRMRSLTAGSFDMVVMRETQDDPKKVEEFYKKDIKAEFTTDWPDKGFYMIGKTKAGDDITIDGLRKAGENVTSIDIVVTKRIESN